MPLGYNAGVTALREYLEFAVHLADQAGRLTLGYYRRQLDPTFKRDDTPVTAADREAEVLLRHLIAERYPEHGIAGEEYGLEREAAEHRWFIDPIDGTKAFVRGVPLYAVLVGLEIAGRVEVGAVYLPALDEMVAAASGLGCSWNGRAARVSEATGLERATICYTDVASFAAHGRQEAFARLCGKSYDRRGWSDAYGYVLVATGRAEAMLDPVVNAWDCGPFPVILREAGGYFGDWRGRETIHAGEALATNGALKEEILALLVG